MNKFTALLNVFRRGSMVADPAMWKARQIKTTALAGLFIAVVQALEAFGYGPLPLSAEDLTVVAGGVLVLVNLVLTPATTEKIGLPPLGGDPSTVDYEGPDHRA